MECPCFSDTDLDWVYSNPSLPLEVDVHRPTSCKPTSSVLALNWAPLDRSWQNPGMIYHAKYDNVFYNNYSVRYDTDNGRGYCRRLDMLFTVDAEQAQVCRQLLEAACERVEINACPCYSLGDLFVKEDDIRNGEVLLDNQQSCSTLEDSTNMTDNSTYGLFELIPNPDTSPQAAHSEWQYEHEDDDDDSHRRTSITQSSTTTISLFTTDRNNICYDYRKSVGDQTQIINHQQAEHCRNLMRDSCEVVQGNNAIFIPQCRDDNSYHFKGRRQKTCSWVAEDPEARCRKYDAETNEHVFERCRRTCGKCSCIDDTLFRHKGDRVKSCGWAGLKLNKRCKRGEIADHCLDTCKSSIHASECCEDDEDFDFFGNFGCAWVNDSDETKEELCRRQLIARNCPQTCGKC